MRSHTCRFGPDEYQLACTWGASQEIAERVCDPLHLAVKLSSNEDFWDCEKVVATLWVGLKHSGEEFTISDVGDMCMKYGIVNFLQVVTDYIFDMVSPGEKAAEVEHQKKTSPQT